jgi:rod shape-determining protein MreD
MRSDRSPTSVGASGLLRTQGMGADARDMHSDAWVVWGSIFLTFLITLLPWRSLLVAPDLLVLVLAFWVVHESSRVGLVVAFFFGLLVDVHDTGPLGQFALTYVLTCYGATVLRRRLLRFNLWWQALHMLPVFVFAKLVAVVLTALLMGLWPGWSWFIEVVVVSMLWVPVGWILLLPGNRLAAMNSHTD